MKEIDRSLHEKYCLKFETSNPDGDAYSGIVVHKTNTLIVINVIDGFELDGLLVLPRKRIVKIRNSEFEECENKIIRVNNEIKKLKKPKWLNDIKTLREVMEYLSKKNIWPVVEIIDENESALYVGPLLSVGKSSFAVKCYDAYGEWEDEYKLRYSEVFKIEIGSRYAKHFNNYMRLKNEG